MNVSRFILPVILTVTLACPALRAADERPWEEKFHEVYQLREGEVLKRIAPPFIPERLEYYRNEERTQAKAIKDPPTYFNFHWRDEKLTKWGYGFIGSSGVTLGRVLQGILELPGYEFEGPADLTSIKLPGDWITRPQATIEQKLEVLAGIVKEASGKTIQFERLKLPRNVIVVSGTYIGETRDENGRIRDVHLYVDEPDPTEGGGGGSGTMEKFITRLGDLVNTPAVIDTPSRPIGTMSWRTHRSSYLSREPAGEERDEKLKRMLARVTEQTGLEFKIEQREVEVWVIGEAGK